MVWRGRSAMQYFRCLLTVARLNGSMAGRTAAVMDQSMSDMAQPLTHLTCQFPVDLHHHHHHHSHHHHHRSIEQ